MKIRLLVDAKKLGGVESHVMNLCEELSFRKHDCKIIFVCYYPDNLLFSQCERRYIHYESCRSLKNLYKLLTKEKPDIIHAHGYKANIYSRLIGMVSKIPIVSTFHAGEKPVGRLIIYDWLDRWSSICSKNICVNSHIAKRLPKQSKIFPNFVSIPNTPNQLRTTKPFHIYYIGRVSPEKGPLQFCQLSLEPSYQLTWHMVGTGPLLEKCQQTYYRTVQFHGLVSNMEEVWPKVDLLCITSFYEGLPLVLLEAMSRGIPVVSFDVGNIKEVTSEQDNIIECFNIAKMQKHIQSHFLKSIEERKIMADRARKKIFSEYSNAVVVSRIEHFYQECIRL